MFNFLKQKINKQEIAELLKTTPAALEEFEKAYKLQALSDEISDNIFEVNAKQIAKTKEGIIPSASDIDIFSIKNRIVDELINKTFIWEFDGQSGKTIDNLTKEPDELVTLEDIMKLPENLRPQLTGHLMKKDLNGNSYEILLDTYRRLLKETNPKKKQNLYHSFRQGLDILDLDPITYEMIDTNPNSMGYWLPKITTAVVEQNFFKIPKTTIIKVPITLLQLAHTDYELLTRTTLDIVDEFCKRVFSLDLDKEYFIKTGTYSSKFDFRNAHVKGKTEVNELGEYLLFIQYQALMMASPLNNRSVYGVSTTNEWVVREFIQDIEKNPTIYKGLPLHTEYRAFVDFDTKKIIGINPYWDPEVMKEHFDNNDENSPHKKHDYIIYAMHEEKLMNRYHENKDKVVENLTEVIQNVDNLHGQWSIDIMQNGDDFWIIDMALAQNSALIKCVPKELRHITAENWLPELN